MPRPTRPVVKDAAEHRAEGDGGSMAGSSEHKTQADDNGGVGKGGATDGGCHDSGGGHGGSHDGTGERSARENRGTFTNNDDPPPPLASRLSSWASWLLIGTVFAGAFIQGSDFASTKDTATVWGAVIGFAAYFAWLAVDLDEQAIEDGKEAADSTEESDKDEQTTKDNVGADEPRSHEKTE